jgi:acetyl esterase/lipase
MSIFRFVVTIPVMILLHNCSLISTINALPQPAGTTETRDIAYANGNRHTLDVYSPPPAEQPAPVVVFFYGGGWTEGTKDWYRFMGASLTSRGVMVVVPDYRLYPDVRFPAFMEDAAQAVAWTRTNAARFGGDPHRLFLMGPSAGATIVTLLALDPEYLRAAGLSPHDVCGVIGIAGPYDFASFPAANMRRVFGRLSDVARAQPINYVNHDAPPMLLMTGTRDHEVDPANTARMAEKLRSMDAPVTVAMYGGVGHGSLLDSFALHFLSSAREDALGFIAAHCRPDRIAQTR